MGIKSSVALLKKYYYVLKYAGGHCFNKCILRIRHAEVASNVKTFGRLFIRGKGSIRIGNNVRIVSCREMNPIGGDVKTVLYAKQGGKIQIGSNTGLSNTAIIAKSEIIIGDNVLIGANCKIYDHNFHSLNFEERMLPGEQGDVSRPVHICDGAFIGAHSIILKGVTIGEKSVIGAGSVVTRSVPAGEIWAGNPAQFIRKI